MAREIIDNLRQPPVLEWTPDEVRTEPRTDIQANPFAPEAATSILQYGDVEALYQELLVEIEKIQNFIKTDLNDRVPIQQEALIEALTSLGYTATVDITTLRELRRNPEAAGIVGAVEDAYYLYLASHANLAPIVYEDTIDLTDWVHEAMEELLSSPLQKIWLDENFAAHGFGSKDQWKTGESHYDVMLQYYWDKAKKAKDRHDTIRAYLSIAELKITRCLWQHLLTGVLGTENLEQVRMKLLRLVDGLRKFDTLIRISMVTNLPNLKTFINALQQKILDEIAKKFRKALLQAAFRAIHDITTPLVDVVDEWEDAIDCPIFDDVEKTMAELVGEQRRRLSQLAAENLAEEENFSEIFKTKYVNLAWQKKVSGTLKTVETVINALQSVISSGTDFDEKLFDFVTGWEESDAKKYQQNQDGTTTEGKISDVPETWTA